MAEKPKPHVVKGEPSAGRSLKTIRCVLPAGSVILTEDLYNLEIDKPVFVDIPEDAFSSVD